ncbi:MAG: hypothetical protein WBV22_10950 [Anaerolineaceae bacterium]
MKEAREVKKLVFLAIKISLVVCVIAAILYTLRVLPLPIVPILNHKSGSFGGFITCHQLENTQWNFAYSSGEYFSPTPIYGIKYPYINMPLVHPYCPRFTPPPYD